MAYKFADRMSGLKASAIREILKFSAFPDVIPFAAGNPAPEAFPIEEVRRISAEIMENEPILALQYNITEGYTPLRDLLKKRMQTQNCFNADTDELIVTSGAQQVMELACKVLCNENDTVICESPSFIGSLNAFRSLKVNLAGVPLENDGIDINLLEDTLKREKNVKALYIIPNFQNPTGLTMSLEKRKAVYELAVKYDILIIEDDPYREIRFGTRELPSVKSFDRDSRVIYAGSFSKILSPGLRVGYVSAPKEVIQKMTVCKQVADVHTNIWAQAVCERFTATADLDRHFNALRNIYRKKSSFMLELADKHFSPSVKYTKPEGGMFVWVTLPDSTDMLAFCRKAVEEYKVAAVPGTAFTVKETDNCNSFRINFSTPTDEQIEKGMTVLGQLTERLGSL
ncbi:MAG: PLP-dependent aminotransferase family protein [Oscillospiraceae bacterium]|jgi:2-aminoadipate transaminase|nr:PLP-dependent aminotransferase family protein [Oscillospiraceae bacterium]